VECGNSGVQGTLVEFTAWGAKAFGPDTLADLAFVIFFAVLFSHAVFSAVRGYRRAGSTEKRSGRRAECRYNLTGNVSGVCPECGTEIWNEGMAIKRG
jgi:hypothetical protein